jgi:hypothetical protein
MREFSKIAMFSTPFEAHLAAGRLEAEGIPAFPVDDFVDGVPFGTFLFVREDDADRALASLADAATESELPSLPTLVTGPMADERQSVSQPKAATRCPSCGSTDVDETPRLLPFLPAKRRCLRCRTPLP